MKFPFLPSDIKTESPLYERAVTLAQHGKPAAYERLEFLGDRVLGLYVAEMLYRHFPNEKEGDWAMRFTILVREKTLADIARQIGLPALLKADEHEPELRDNNSVLSDVMEAFIAAFYLDQGAVKTRAFIEKYWSPLLQQSHETIKDAKSALQEWSQRYAKCLPEYEFLVHEGPDHAPFFRVQVKISHYGIATGEGGSKREAMQEAASKLLKIVSENPICKSKKKK